MMKKLLVVAAIITWAGTLYGAYAWGSRNEPSDGLITAETAERCSIGRENLQNANRALDKVITFEHISLPLRAWGRTFSENHTNPAIEALVSEANFQQARLEAAGKVILGYC